MSIFTPTYRHRRTLRPHLALRHGAELCELGVRSFSMTAATTAGRRHDRHLCHDGPRHRSSSVRATNSGVIDDMKYRACTAARGEISWRNSTMTTCCWPMRWRIWCAPPGPTQRPGFFYALISAKINNKFNGPALWRGLRIWLSQLHHTEHFKGQTVWPSWSHRTSTPRRSAASSPRPIVSACGRTGHLPSTVRRSHNRLLSVADDIDLIGPHLPGDPDQSRIRSSAPAVATTARTPSHAATRTYQRLVRFLRVRYDQPSTTGFWNSASRIGCGTRPGNVPT